MLNLDQSLHHELTIHHSPFNIEHSTFAFATIRLAGSKGIAVSRAFSCCAKRILRVAQDDHSHESCVTGAAKPPRHAVPETICPASRLTSPSTRGDTPRVFLTFTQCTPRGGRSWPSSTTSLFWERGRAAMLRRSAPRSSGSRPR